MKKVTNKRPDNLGLAVPRPTTTQKPRTTFKDKKSTLKPSSSENNLLDRSNRNTPLRKASTPTHEKTGLSLSPDISQILSAGGKTDLLKKRDLPENPNKEINPRKTAAPKELDFKDQLNLEYTRYLQAVFKREFSKNKAADIDESLDNLQKRIAENQRILQQTSERLKNVNFNKEVDLLHNLNNPSWNKVLETLGNSNCEDYFSALEEKLDKHQNRLKLKNVDLPEGGGAQLLSVISETLDAVEKLKSENNLEAHRLLSEVKEINKSNFSSLSKCKEKLTATEELLYTKATLELCTRDKA